MLEKDIERYLFEKVKLLGGRALKLNTGVRGMPDRLILLPGENAVFVEMKAPGEQPRLLQQKRITQLRELGFWVEVIDTKTKVDRLIRVFHHLEGVEGID